MKKNEIIRVIVTILIVAISISITYYYTQNKKNESYVVSFDTDGGTEIKTQEVDYGENVNKPKTPLKEGYIFIDWTYLGQTYDFTTKVDSDMVLKAKWEEIPQPREVEPQAEDNNNEEK